MTGTSLPRVIVNFGPSVPRSCGLATILVFVSDSRNRTIAVGTAMYQSAVEMPREIVLRLKTGGGTIALGAVDRPVFVVWVPPPPAPCPGVVGEPGVVGAFGVPGVTMTLGDCSGEKITPTAYSERFNP